MSSNAVINDSVSNAKVIRTYTKQQSPWKTLVYTRDNLEATEEQTVSRSACVTKGDTLEFGIDKTVYVRCKNGDKRAKILPFYSVPDDIQLGNLTIPVLVKEITEPEEYQAYRHLQFYHYRGKSLFGRHAPLVMCASHPFLPSVVGYIELVTPFGASKPRREFFNAQCKLDGIGWEQWNNDTSRKHISLFVRIARCVVHPELRGMGVGQQLVKHSIQFARDHWQSGGMKPYILEICADMLRYVPFTESAEMVYIGDTEGDQHRIVKDFSYFIKNLDRFENKEILPDSSSGIVQAKRSKWQALLDASPDKTPEQALADLEKQIQKPTLKGYAKYKDVLSLPKPVYAAGLIPDASKFIKDRASELKLQSSEKICFKATEPIQTPIQIEEMEVKFTKRVRRTQLTHKVEKAFGISLDTLEDTIFSGLTVSIEPKTLWLVTGMSGTGKSTFLKLLNQKICHTTELLNITGCLRMPKNAKIGTLSPIRSKKPLIDVFGKGDVNQGLQLMNSVGLSEAFLYVKSFQQLSMGQKYRAMLASLFSKASNIWLIDEFCENLDPITTHLIAKKLSTVARKRKATVIVSAADYAPFLETLRPDKILLLQGATRCSVFTFDEFQTFLEKANQDLVQESTQDV